MYHSIRPTPGSLYRNRQQSDSEEEMPPEPIPNQANPEPDDYYSRFENKKEERSEVLVMTLDIGQNKQENLKLYEDDDPIQVALDFCTRHGFSRQVFEFLSQNISENLEVALRERSELLAEKDSKEAFKEREPNQLNWSRKKHEKYIDGVEDCTEEPEEEEDDYESEKHISNSNGYEAPPKIDERDGSSHGNGWGTSPNGKYRFTPNGQGREIHQEQLKEEDDGDDGRNEPEIVGKPRMDWMKSTDQKENDYKIYKSRPPIHERLYQNAKGGSTKFSSSSKEFYDQKTISKEGNFNSVGGKAANSKQKEQSQVKSSAKKQETPKNPERPKSSKQYESSRKRENNSGMSSGKGEIWDKLYYEGLKKKEMRMREIEESVYQQKDKEDENLLFKPQINEVSSKLAELMKERRGQKPTEDYLIEQGKVLKEKKELARNIHDEEKRGSLPFTPEINSNSRMIAQEKSTMRSGASSGTGVFDELHDEWKAKEAKKKMLAQKM